jgi:hypothetical protein
MDAIKKWVEILAPTIIFCLLLADSFLIPVMKIPREPVIYSLTGFGILCILIDSEEYKKKGKAK